jgi:hypothetical protein
MHSPRLAQLLIFLAVCMLTALAYVPGLNGGFALDDYTNVVDNSAIAIQHLDWSSLSHAMFSFQAGPAMRPLSMLSFALNAYYTGASGAYALKLTNLVIHLCNGVLVLLLLRRLFVVYRERQTPSADALRLEWLAYLSAGFWLVHPLNAMPVLYVVQRETSLSSLFMLLGLHLYVAGRLRGGHRGAWMVWAGVPALTVVAVLCKESGALLPVYALVIEYFMFRFRRADGSLDRSIAAFYALFLLLPGCLGLGWALFAHGGGVLDYSGRDFTLGERLLSESRVVWSYIRWTLLPDPASLGLYHDDIAPSRDLLHPITTLFAVAGILGLVVTGFLMRRRRPLVAFGIAWFLGGQLMESTIFPLELAFEHRCYLPDLGLILAVVSLLLPLRADAPARAVRYVILGLALCLCATATWMRAYDWRDNLSFATAEAQHHPGSPYATYMLGQTYANLALMSDPSQYDNAVASLEAASAVPNSTVIPDVSLVLVEAQLKGKLDPDVMPRIATKVGDRKLAASDIQGLAALGDCVDKRNCKVAPAEMQAIFHSALANPYLGQLKDTHANILVIDGNYEAIMDRDYQKARSLMAEAATLVPGEPQYRENLVTMDISLQDKPQAEQDMQALKRMDYLGHLDPVIADLQKQVDELPPSR